MSYTNIIHTMHFTRVLGSSLLLCLGILFIGCKNDNQASAQEVTLKMWIEDKNNYEKLIGYFESKKCDEAESLLVKFKANQFKNQSYLRLARCFADDIEKSKYYLTEAIKEGYHIKLIDSILFENVWAEIKSVYPELNKQYWNQQDTTYFRDVEQLVYLDQKVRYDRPQGSNDFSAEIKQDSISTKWLVEHCKSNGFPKIYENSHFEYRVINPLILTIHAQDVYKKELLDCAIEAAKSGKISWMIPIQIKKSFYVVRKPPNAVHPLFMLYFDKENNLDYEKSLLQLYSIQEFYGRDMPSKITLRPSLSNNLNQNVVEKHLAQVKKTLVNEFLLVDDEIVIDLTPSKENVYDDYTDSYLYTISASRY